MTLLRQEDIILSSMTQTEDKWDLLALSRGDFWMTWTCHGIPCFHFYFFCLETTLWESTWMKATSATVIVFFESVIPKVLDHSYIQSSLLTITRKLDNSIWKTPWKTSIRLTYYCMLLFLSKILVFKFNLMLIE